MRNSIFVSVIIVTLIILNIAQLVLINKNNSDNNRQALSYTNNLQFKKSIIDESVKFSDYLLVDEENDSISLKILLEKKKLILRVSEFNCQSCVDSTLLLINKADSLVKSNIIILASIVSNRDRIVFKRIHQLNYPFYYIDEGVLPLKAEKGITPYFFMMDSSLTTDLLFIPSKKNTDLTRFYLDIINAKF